MNDGSYYSIAWWEIPTSAWYSNNFVFIAKVGISHRAMLTCDCSIRVNAVLEYLKSACKDVCLPKRGMVIVVSINYYSISSQPTN